MYITLVFLIFEMAMSGESQFPPLHHPRGDLILTHYLTLELSVGPTQRIFKKDNNIMGNT